MCVGVTDSSVGVLYVQFEVRRHGETEYKPTRDKTVVRTDYLCVRGAECIVNCQIVWSVSCDDCHVSAYQSLCDNHYYYSPRDTIVLPPVRWNRYFDLDIKFPWLIFLNSFLCVLLAAWHCPDLTGVGGGCE